MSKGVSKGKTSSKSAQKCSKLLIVLRAKKFDEKMKISKVSQNHFFEIFGNFCDLLKGKKIQLGNEMLKAVQYHFLDHFRLFFETIIFLKGKEIINKN